MKKYKFRNFPCVMWGQELRWSVTGTHKIKGNGVLEWCLDEFDAKDLCDKMKKDSDFSNLKVEFIR